MRTWDLVPPLPHLPPELDELDEIPPFRRRGPAVVRIKPPASNMNVRFAGLAGQIRVVTMNIVARVLAAYDTDKSVPHEVRPESGYGVIAQLNNRVLGIDQGRQA